MSKLRMCIVMSLKQSRHSTTIRVVNWFLICALFEQISMIPSKPSSINCRYWLKSTFFIVFLWSMIKCTGKSFSKRHSTTHFGQTAPKTLPSLRKNKFSRHMSQVGNTGYTIQSSKAQMITVKSSTNVRLPFSR